MTGFQISLLNIEGDEQFTASQRAIEELVASFCVGLADEISPTMWSRRIGKRDAILGQQAAIGSHLLDPAELLHVMTHANGRGNAVRTTWWGLGKTNFAIGDLVAYVDGCEGDEDFESPDFDCILMDGCRTYSKTWFDKVARLLAPGRQCVYIGTTKDVNWQECTTYTSAFYLSFLQKGRPAKREGIRAAFEKAHEDATTFYHQVRRNGCPFKVEVITSTR